MRTFVFFMIVLGATMKINAQTEAAHIRKGNELYKQGNFGDAEIEYRKGLEKSKLSWNSVYNLSNSLYKQKRFKEAEQLLDSLADRTRDKTELAKVYHNLANTALQEKEYQKSIDTYKKALKLDPTAEDSRYNLSYAMKMKQRQEQQQQQKSNPKSAPPKESVQRKPEKSTFDKNEADRIMDELDRKEKEMRKDLEKNSHKEPAVSGGKDW